MGSCTPRDGSETRLCQGRHRGADFAASLFVVHAVFVIHVQNGDSFTAGSCREHCHPANPGPLHNKLFSPVVHTEVDVTLFPAPHEHVLDAFSHLRSSVSHPLVIQLFNYVKDTCTWLLMSSVWSPSNWSIFKQSIRTNNAVTGWHQLLNLKAGAGGGLSLYKLIPLMRYNEAKLVNMQMTQSKMCRNRRRCTLFFKQRYPGSPLD